MRSSLLISVFLLASNLLAAQLYIQSGASFRITGTEQLTLNNTSLINNGTFIAGNSVVSFTGNASASIGGAQFIQFYDLYINKSNQSLVSLQNSYTVSHRIYFNAGFLNLNGFDLNLGTTGRLIGENNAGRITGNGGGAVIFDTVLNNPGFVNPGGLGVFITSPANMGNVSIHRSHQWDLSEPGLINSIRRQFSFSVANNSNLNATLQFRYFDGELNNLQEDGLAFYETADGIQWNGLGFTSRDMSANYVEENGIQSLHQYTLSGIGIVLPVIFSDVEIKCQGSKAIVTWKTAQEQHSDHFEIEKSSDGFLWNVIGAVAAAGNSTEEKTYSYIDPENNNSYYRIAEYDTDGGFSYSKIIRALCEPKDVFRLWPNPTHGPLHINIFAANASVATVKIYDSKGGLIKQQKANLVQGNNMVAPDISQSPAGAYTIVAEWNNGHSRHTTQVIKQ